MERFQYFRTIFNVYLWPKLIYPKNWRTFFLVFGIGNSRIETELSFIGITWLFCIEWHKYLFGFLENCISKFWDVNLRHKLLLIVFLNGINVDFFFKILLNILWKMTEEIFDQEVKYFYCQSPCSVKKAI